LALADFANWGAAAPARFGSLAVYEVLLLKIARAAVGVQPIAQTAAACDQSGI
jgi:hypothetical protein